MVQLIEFDAQEDSPFESEPQLLGVCHWCTSTTTASNWISFCRATACRLLTANFSTCRRAMFPRRKLDGSRNCVNRFLRHIKKSPPNCRWGNFFCMWRGLYIQKKFWIETAELYQSRDKFPWRVKTILLPQSCSEDIWLTRRLHNDKLFRLSEEVLNWAKKNFRLPSLSSARR